MRNSVGAKTGWKNIIRASVERTSSSRFSSSLQATLLDNKDMLSLLDDYEDGGEEGEIENNEYKVESKDNGNNDNGTSYLLDQDQNQEEEEDEDRDGVFFDSIDERTARTISEERGLHQRYSTGYSDQDEEDENGE